MTVKTKPEPTRILDLGTGKHWKQYLGNVDDEIICVDKSYHSVDFDKVPKHIKLKNMNIFEYLNENSKIFDKINANRVFEHIDYEKIPYLLYLCKESLKDHGKISFIVPDFLEIFKKIKAISRNDSAKNFNKDMIDIHTELFNTTEDPHRSIWTKELAIYYMELEDFWKDINIECNVELDNRNWYMSITAKKYSICQLPLPQGHEACN